MTEPDPIAALAAQLVELRGQLARYTGETGHLRARMEEDSGQVVMLRLQVKQLSEGLEEATGQRTAEDPAAPYWVGLDPDERAAGLGELREWVENVARVQWPGYLAKLPPCWPAHGEAVWELANLMTEWRRVYSDPDGRPLADALVWFDRWLPGVLGRLERAVRCDISGCRLAKTSQWGPSPPPYS